MRSLLLVGLVVATAGLVVPAAETDAPDLPEGWELLYRQDFAGEKAIEDFVFSDPEGWTMGTAGERRVLEFGSKSAYKPKVRSPRIIGLIKDRQFRDFILEAEVRQTGREYGHRDTCFFYGFTDASKFYYTHIATKADPHAHNVFLVKDAPRTAIAAKTTKGVKWGQDWHTVRIIRKADEGTIRVYFDDMAKPIMEAKDTNFAWGWVGFGSFDDEGQIGRVRIWGPEVKRKTCTLFEPKKPAPPPA